MAAIAAFAVPALADEAAIRKNLATRLPQLPKIDEVSKMTIPGIFEIRIGTDIVNTDERGHHLLQGPLFDTRSRMELTELRIEKLTAIDFATLPLKDAIAPSTCDAAALERNTAMAEPTR